MRNVNQRESLGGATWIRRGRENEKRHSRRAVRYREEPGREVWACGDLSLARSPRRLRSELQ